MALGLALLADDREVEGHGRFLTMVVASAATMPAPVLVAVARAFGDAGIDLGALGHAWVRVLPIVIIVPAFGLRALPASARAVIALALAAVIVPGVALGSGASAERADSLLGDAARGLSVAVAAAVPLWAATMAGGVIDALRGTPDASSSAPTVEGRATPLGVPLSILASAIFLAGGGASRVVAAVAGPERESSPVLLAAHDLAAGISLAVALGAPVLIASIVVEVGAALIARAASPAQVHPLLAPLRALVALVVLAVGIDRIAAALALAMR
jgi:type III secretory pathway component EscT